MPNAFIPNNFHLRNVVLFLFLSGLNVKDIHDKLIATYDTNAPSQATIYRYVARYKEGDYSFEDEPKSGRPRELDLDKLREIVEDDPYLTTRDMETLLDVDWSTAARGLKTIGKKAKFRRWVPHAFSDFDKDRRVDAALNLLTYHRTTDWLDRVITGDERWVLYDNSERRAMWVDEDEQPEDVPKPSLHPKKILLCIWWSVNGIEYWETLKEGETVTAQVYTAQLRKLKLHLENTRGAQAEIYFQHDNARPHVARSVKAELEGYGWHVLPHPPYSPDLAPSDYHLFKHLSHFLRGQNFKDRKDVESALKGFFDSQTAEFYKAGIHALPSRWKKTVNANGNYF